eukprot:TRINITY_DN916_c0_g1_i1.p1 TRINITY_DN916_c0_g1~~TRINITY_DN916_c0_g1_i1.p1  ORF type:complete len:371 (-),score=74.53 TRINITY_DN916_c0_g1_i1:38-1150(-)
MNKLLLITLAAILAVALAKTKWHQLDDYTFEKYVKEHRKVYETHEEERMRRNIFNQNLARIKAHNRDTTKTWKEGVNHFTDRTEEEFARVRGLKKGALFASKASRPQHMVNSKENFDVSTLPPAVDWRTSGIISAIKDQGDCGSCWTFATTETLEAYWALATGELQDLSEQQILDCTPNPDQCGGTGGCGGGTVELAYARINAMGGLASEWTYPYLSYTGKAFTCRFNETVPAVKVAGFTDLPSNQYLPVMTHVAKVGPLAVSVDASAWGAYESGVFNGCNQTNPDLDHAVQLVGYGSDSQLGNYWIVRNSWNPTWGEDGFIRIARPANPTCGIDIHPSDGDACKNSPPTVKVCGTCGILFDTTFPTIQK